MTNEQYSEYLAHHGVLGQKWGVRRYQNPDGTLTRLGRDRLYSESDSKAGYESAKSQIKIGSTLTSSASKVRGRTIDNDDIREAGTFLKNQSTAITKEFDNICAETKNHYNSLASNPNFKKEIMNKLKEDYVAGDMVDDLESLKFDVEDYVDSIGSKYYSEKLKKSWSVFQDGVDAYYENVKSITDDIVGQYGDMPVDSFTKVTKNAGLFTPAKTTTEEYKYSDVVENSLHKLGDSTWVSYLNNHSEMSYLEDPGYSAREKVINQISDEFMKTKH